MPDTTTTATAPSTPPKPRPDAVKIPLDWKASSDNPLTVGLSIARKCKALLGVDLTRGENAYVRTQFDHRFATRYINDTIYFPHGHHRALQPRYNWSPQPDGSEFGYLVPEAKEGGE
jgi:hypothetical protein